jgi:hypothetical protein
MAPSLCESHRESPRNGSVFRLTTQVQSETVAGEEQVYRSSLLLWLGLFFADEQPCRGDANLEFCGPRHRDESARAILGIEQRRKECVTTSVA